MKILLLLLISVYSFAQTKKLDTVFCDCDQANILTVYSKTIYGKTIAPVGFGKEKEISTKKQKTEYAFDKEHNSAWYKLVITSSGEMVMNITPTKKDDDYDFMLFKAGKGNFCDSLKKHAINPVRACISRDKEEINGKTGIDLDSKKEFVRYGIGPAYCKAISVKKGEVYYLVLDNVYPKGEGHTLEIEIAKVFTFAGTIVDENKKPVKADIALTAENGDTVKLAKSDENGNYQFFAPMTRNDVYSLNFYNDSNFSFTQNIRLADTARIRKLQTVLPRLKKGNKYSVGSINFVGGSVQYLPRAVPAMDNLYKLLKKNPKLKIKIIGHSNGRDMQDEAGIIAFTKGRATTIRNYLAIKGIDEKRISIDGKGDHEMLYALPKATEAQQEENRRVEIEVEEF